MLITHPSGGLELRNPLIELLAVRDAIGSDPAREFSKQMEEDAESYRVLQERWNSNVSALTSLYETFPSFEDYIAHRETGLSQWKTRYCDLMSTARPKQLTLPHSHAQEVQRPMDFYDRWVLSLYGYVFTTSSTDGFLMLLRNSDQVVKKFGSLEAVDPTLIPVGLVHLFRGSRHQWDQ